MTTLVTPRAETRIGFHYLNDTLHYREVDLQTWLPEVKALGGSWLTLIAPNDRAIPEAFLRGLLDERIEPVLHFHLPLDHIPDLNSLNLLLNSYANWGVRFVALYDRPNSRCAWPTASWAQSDLVERFLDFYLPAAGLIKKVGMVPVFPPLEPGGDYWDTAFLRVALQGILRRGQADLAESLVFGAYAWANESSIGWGAGGPERWPQARPYSAPPNQEDQRGFYIFDWYLAIVEAILGQPRPVLLLAAGPTSLNGGLETHTRTNLAIARLMLENQKTTIVALPPVSSHVLACNFWLLSATAASKDACMAWFQPDGRALPIVPALTRLRNERDGKPVSLDMTQGMGARLSIKPISHYILLPRQSDLPDNMLQNIWPMISAQFPTIGFSLEEAALAERVTVVGDEIAISEDAMENLRCTGCKVERLIGDGISIAPIEQSTHILPSEANHE